MVYNDLTNELGTNFIEYSYAVNSDRAIPDATSGLKPVARRILWGAFNGGYTSNKEHSKCARIVGDVMGQWHPHGDSSIYGALVRLAQPWVMRYPLIDFHGNMGNIGGDGPAAYRYTNARLSKLAEDGMLQGIKKKNVDFIPNYDENDYEPSTLPTIFPNLLCNPNSGIGVSIACNWAPNNLVEVANAIYDYIDGKEPMIPGPDFPTGGIVINKNDIPNILATGRGSVKIRGRYRIEKNNIIFYEIPYGTTVEGLLTEIGDKCESKEIEGITNIRNDSDRKGLRITIQCEKGIEPETIVKKLFLKTKLQTSFSYNQVALINKTPTELNFKQCIELYLKHNIECLIKETLFDLEKAENKLEIINGLLIALEDIDNIISKIKKSENANAAKICLIKDYGMTENQAKAVLDMKLAKLAKLEKIEVEKEQKELIEKITNFKNILTKKELQIAEIKLRLSNIVKKYGDERRTELLQIEIPKEEKEIEEIIPEDVVVIISKNGNIKRIPASSFKVQNRRGRGVKTNDETALSTISTNTIDNLMIFSSIGKMYKLLVNDIPVGSNISVGTNIKNLIKISDSEEVITINSLNRKTNAEYVIFITKKGYFKKTKIEEYQKIKRSTGIAAINLKEGDSLAHVTFIKDEEMIVLTKNGMAIHFETTDIKPIGRLTTGVHSIKLDESDEVLTGLPLHKTTDSLAIFTSEGYAKKCSLSDFPVQIRGGKGLSLYKTGNLVGAAMVEDKDSIVLIGRPNSICISAKDIPLLNRASAGNIMIKDSKINSIVKI